LPLPFMHGSNRGGDQSTGFRYHLPALSVAKRL